MSARIVIADETSTGKVLHELQLECLLPVVTAAQLIELRVRDEVARFNARTDNEIFRGLIQPTDAEATLNGYEYRLRRHAPVDADEQCRKAHLAFESNGFRCASESAAASTARSNSGSFVRRRGSTR